ncbi:thioredoxin domain-containing protein, partial [Candidatus Sumerlaeota bacterium]|nr:thioredoxin domain-containing protein [Candidatus Sumerlaeota bacterium]
AVELDIPEPELRARLEASRQKLFEVRERRIHPLKDDKILTDWNGLMIAALAKAGRALDEPLYIAAASKAADFLMANLRDERGRLLKRYRLGEAGLPGLLEDYAYVTWGLLELYEATFEVRYLAGAIELNEITLDHFWDDERGAFFLTADDGEELLVRPKQIYDGARPSGNSVAALNLLRIGRITARPELEAKSEAVMKAFAGLVGPGPGGYTYLMSALEFATGPAYEIVIAGAAGADDTAAMLRALRREFVPNKVVLFRPDGEAPAITDIAAFTREQTSLEGKATAYVCQNYACEAPTTEVAAMLEALGG